MSGPRVSIPGDIPVEEIALAPDEATFVGGRGRPIHRWYKLRPSFSPHLVAYLLERLGTGRRRPVLDPFAGAGTTPIEAALRGRPALAVEINPFLAAHVRAALDWSATAAEVRAARRRAAASLRAAARRAERLGVDGVIAETGVALPPIHNVFRWWRPDVLAHLLAAKNALHGARDTHTRRLLWLALGTACIEVANIKRLHPTLTFHDRSGERIDVPGTLQTRLAEVAEDLALAAGLPRPAVTVREGNSRALDAVLGGRPLRADVVTSPPYCNRYSYVWETRPHLYLLDLVADARRTTALDVDGIGGTWGQATSSLVKGEVRPTTAVLARLLGPVLARLRPADNLMANYAVKYFNGMDEHFDALGRLLRPGSRLAYVVGNSRLKGVDVPTEALLAGLLRAKPWCRVERLLVFRRRIGKRALYESAILARVV